MKNYFWDIENGSKNYFLIRYYSSGNERIYSNEKSQNRLHETRTIAYKKHYSQNESWKIQFCDFEEATELYFFSNERSSSKQHSPMLHDDEQNDARLKSLCAWWHAFKMNQWKITSEILKTRPRIIFWRRCYLTEFKNMPNIILFTSNVKPFFVYCKEINKLKLLDH